jgi:hypothetical protein
MKVQNNILAPLSFNASKKLTTIVEETLAYFTIQKKTFTAVDMWNIQRRKKGVKVRRHFNW